MHKCEHCGTEFDGNFCPHCGTPAPADVCPNCGAKLSPGSKFCPSCGTQIGAPEKKSLSVKKPDRADIPPENLSPEEKKAAVAKRTRTWVAHKRALKCFMWGLFPGYGFIATIMGIVRVFESDLRGWNPANLEKERKKAFAYTITAFIFAVVYLAVSILSHVLLIPILSEEIYEGVDVGAIMIPLMSWILVADALAAGILGLCSLPLGKTLSVDYFGTEMPAPEAAPLYTAEEIAQSLTAKPEGAVKTKSHDAARFWALGVLVLYLVAAVIAVPTAVYTNPYRIDLVKIGNAEKIALGADKATVKSIFGDPHIPLSVTEPNTYQWEYVDNHYRKFEVSLKEALEKEEKLLEKGDLEALLSLEESILQLKEKEATMTYTRLLINFDGEEKVQSVLFNNSYRKDKDGEETKSMFGNTYSDIVYSTEQCSSAEEFASITVKVYYDDGSYYYSHLYTDNYKLDGNRCTVKWTPPYHAAVEAEFTIVGDWLAAPAE